MNEHALLVLGGILMTGLACQWLAWRMKLPAIIFLLLAGILGGPVLGLVHPDALFGELFFPFVSLAVAVILFEGSLTLKLYQIPGLEKVIRNLITFGVIISWTATAVGTRLLLGFSWEVSFLFGAVMVVTGPTVIMPMLRTVRPKDDVANVLQWEGILIDPIGAILAVLVFQFIVSGGLGGGFASGILVFGKIVLIGLFFGISGGFFFALLLKRYWIPQYLHNFAALSLVALVFAVSNFFEAESGLLSVTIMGVWLANIKDVEMGDILDFKESLSILLVSMLFVLLAARMDLDGFLQLGWPALGLFALIQFFIRPLSVHVCALGSKLHMNERRLLSWIAPRGIVAAAISALFAIKLESIGYPQAEQMVPLTFMIILGTVLLQSFTARPIARFLGVAEPEPNGFLIVGANAVARAVAVELKKNGFRVLLADQNRDHVAEARMQDLSVFWGNPVSEYAERRLNLNGIGHLLALTKYVELNVLAAQHYRMELCRKNIYTIRNHKPQKVRTEEKFDFRHQGRYLFSESVTYKDLEEMLDSGALMKTTLLTEEFSFKDYLGQKKENRLPMFAIDPGGNIHVFTAEPLFTPEVGWKILGLAW